MGTYICVKFTLWLKASSLFLHNLQIPNFELAKYYSHFTSWVLPLEAAIGNAQNSDFVLAAQLALVGLATCRHPPLGFAFNFPHSLSRPAKSKTFYFSLSDTQIHKYTNTQTHKYTNTNPPPVTSPTTYLEGPEEITILGCPRCDDHNHHHNDCDEW